MDAELINMANHHMITNIGQGIPENGRLERAQHEVYSIGYVAE